MFSLRFYSTGGLPTVGHFLGTKRGKIRFNPQIIMLVRKRGKIPEILSCGKTKVTAQTIPIFITKPKRPKVKILKGRVTIFKIGLIKKLIRPKTRPVKIKICQESANSTSGINRIANQIPKIPAIIWRIKRLTILKIANI